MSSLDPVVTIQPGCLGTCLLGKVEIETQSAKVPSHVAQQCRQTAGKAINRQKMICTPFFFYSFRRIDISTGASLICIAGGIVGVNKIEMRIMFLPLFLS